MSTTSVITVTIVDDHQIMIDGLTSIISNDSSIKIISTAHNGQEALEKIAQQPPHVLLTDINMPFINGVELSKKVKVLYPNVKILALSMFGDSEHINEMIEAGVSGYILKNTGNIILLNAIKTIAAGGTFFDAEVTSEIMRSLTQHSQHKVTLEKVHLTERELEIIKLIAQELNNAHIGDALFISERTVESHRKNIYRKTNTNNIVGLLKFAFANGIITN
jgi:two-component system nitrate/nitrite response regulator NarL